MPITGRGGAETPSPRPRSRENGGFPPFLSLGTIGHGAQNLGFLRVSGLLVHQMAHWPSYPLAIGPNRPLFYRAHRIARADE